MESNEETKKVEGTETSEPSTETGEQTAEEAKKGEAPAESGTTTSAN